MTGRVIFLCPFSRTEITGGIKTVYSHAELLTESGIEALVFQPEGHPVWFESRAARLVDPARFKATQADILVFSESLSGQIGEMARATTTGRKVLFCQNQYYLTTHALVAEPDFAARFMPALPPRARSPRVSWSASSIVKTWPSYPAMSIARSSRLSPSAWKSRWPHKA